MSSTSMKGITPQQIIAHLGEVGSSAADKMAQWMWDRTEDGAIKVTPTMMWARMKALVRDDPGLKADKAVVFLARWAKSQLPAVTKAEWLPCPTGGCQGRRLAQFPVCAACHAKQSGNGNTRRHLAALRAEGATYKTPPPQEKLSEDTGIVEDPLAYDIVGFEIDRSSYR